MLISAGLLDCFTLPYTEVQLFQISAISWLSLPDFGQKWLSDYPHFETKWWLLHINLEKPLFFVGNLSNIFFINYIASWSVKPNMFQTVHS